MAIYEPIRIYDPDGTVQLELDRTFYLTSRVKNHKVLHIGCTDYPITLERLKAGNFLHEKLTEVCSHVVGIDNSVSGIKLLKKCGLTNARLMDAESIILREKYDFILAGDIIEHMNNPGKFLNKAKELLRPSGRLIIGVPNAYSFNILRYILGKEPTHKDHTFFFSVKSLSELCSRYNLLPTKLIFTTQPKGKYEKYWYVKMRDLLIKLQKRLAPSLIMEFQPGECVDTSKYFEWK